MGTAVAMRERPILFTPANVRLILDGHKTQTRRVAKVPLAIKAFSKGPRDDWWYWMNNIQSKDVHLNCPFGQVGDRLWVRERFARDPDGTIYYAADRDGKLNHWTPSIHMPRWACRLTLEITAIRVERVQEISADDAKAEGCRATDEPQDEYRDLWDSINANREARHGWDVNPWVWAITFRRVA